MPCSRLRGKTGIWLAVFSALLICCLLVSMRQESREAEGKLLLGNGGSNRLYLEKYDLTIYGTDKDGITYFCMPAFAELTSLDQGGSENKVLLTNGDLMTDPRTGEEQDILVTTPAGESVPWKICFLRSENLCSVFLDLDDKGIEDINHDIYSDTSMSVISPKGDILYSSEDVRIKGRGNASWNGDKKPYEIKLQKKADLCGMSSSKKWVLLANFFDPTKMYNKLAFDTSEAIGMEYSIESEWVDLYVDGSYTGNYLLCREPGIGKSDLDIADLEKPNEVLFKGGDITERENVKAYEYDGAAPDSGGYLIEKNTTFYYNEKPCGFRTDHNYFTIKSPDNASIAQAEYISLFVNTVDAAIRNDGENALSDIDTHSFTRRFIVEELFFNDDAFVTSYYFYKKPGEDVLYAGPVWDYDGAVGNGEGSYLNTEGTILDQRDNLAAEDLDFKNPLDWDVMLYDNGDYRSCLTETFRDCLPALRDMTEHGIDDDYDRIRASVRMDYAVWGDGWGAGQYEDPDDNVGFAKDFLTRRLEYLCSKWDIY